MGSEQGKRRTTLRIIEPREKEDHYAQQYYIPRVVGWVYTSGCGIPRVVHLLHTLGWWYTQGGTPPTYLGGIPRVYICLPTVSSRVHHGSMPSMVYSRVHRHLHEGCAERRPGLRTEIN